MQIKLRKLTLDDVNDKTYFKKRHLEYIKRYLEDPEKKERIKEQECVCCYYSSKIGGAAMTQTQCGLCEKEMYFGSTCVDALCQECAKNNKLCKHCGADMEYKTRKKL